MLKSVLQQFPPAYFTMVMATGIISLAASGLYLPGLADGLFYLNLGLYPLFLLLLVGRALLYFPGLKAELLSHDKGANYLALVAATCLVGNQFALLRHNQAVGQALWVFGAGCWVLLTFTFLLGVTLRRDKPPLETGLNGGWLLLVVSTQALAVLEATLVPGSPLPDDLGLFIALSLFLLGAFLYVVIGTLLFYRLAFVQVKPDEVSAPYWISVGASAITVLAGAALLSAQQQTHALADTAGFIKGLSALFWAVATGWIPLVALLRAWHHLRERPAFAFHPEDWSMVFPLGMYAAATARFSKVLLPALGTVATGFFYVALLAWALTLVGMLHHLATAAGRRPAS